MKPPCLRGCGLQLSTVLVRGRSVPCLKLSPRRVTTQFWGLSKPQSDADDKDDASTLVPIPPVNELLTNMWGSLKMSKCELPWMELYISARAQCRSICGRLLVEIADDSDVNIGFPFCTSVKRTSDLVSSVCSVPHDPRLFPVYSTPSSHSNGNVGSASPLLRPSRAVSPLRLLSKVRPCLLSFLPLRLKGGDFSGLRCNVPTSLCKLQQPSHKLPQDST